MTNDEYRDFLQTKFDQGLRNSKALLKEKQGLNARVQAHLETALSHDDEEELSYDVREYQARVNNAINRQNNPLGIF